MNVSCDTRPGPLVPAGEEPWSFDTTTCTYSLNNAFAFDTYIQSLHLPSSAGRPSEEASELTQVKTESPDVADGLGNLVKHNRTYLATVLAYATLFDDEKTKGLPAITPSLLDPEVVACTLYRCAQVYANASVLNGTLRSPAPSAAHDLRIIYDDDGGGSGTARTFDNIAAAMTGQVGAADSSHRGVGGGGLAWEGETYVRVGWAWLAFPLAVLTASAAYLGGHRQRGG